MSPAFERRIRERRARMLERSSEYRHRSHARGVWFRLRRVLADASAAFVISEDEARTLIRGDGVGNQVPLHRAELRLAALLGGLERCPAEPIGVTPAPRVLGPGRRGDSHEIHPKQQVVAEPAAARTPPPVRES